MPAVPGVSNGSAYISLLFKFSLISWPGGWVRDAAWMRWLDSKTTDELQLQAGPLKYATLKILLTGLSRNSYDPATDSIQCVFTG